MNRIQKAPKEDSSRVDALGTELSLGRSFEWASRHWLIPAVYVCERGLIVDFCMRADADDLRAFIQKWRLSPANDDCTAFSPEEQLLLAAENPLSLAFTPALAVNGRTLSVSERTSAAFNPCLPQRKEEPARTLRHYGLSDAFGWVITRALFPWNGRKPSALHSIELSLRRTPAPLPGPHFTVHKPGDVFCFAHPFTGTEHALTALSLEERTLPEAALSSGLPAHFTLLRYALDPEPVEPVLVSDSCEGNRSFSDGPTALLVSGGPHTACSALRASPSSGGIEWRLTFQSSSGDDFTLSLL